MDFIFFDDKMYNLVFIVMLVDFVKYIVIPFAEFGWEYTGLGDWLRLKS
jgi:hypothetical protein